MTFQEKIKGKQKMNEEELKKILENHEKRIKDLETNGSNSIKESVVRKKDNFVGISKGINELIKDGFFDTPKGVDEVIPELSRRGFFGGKEKIDSSIRKTFFGTKRILDRMKEGSFWKYFKRK